MFFSIRISFAVCQSDTGKAIFVEHIIFFSEARQTNLSVFQTDFNFSVKTT